MEIIVDSPKFGKHIVLIDDEDFALASTHKWHINYHKNNVYVTSVSRNKNGVGMVSIKLHRLILGFPNQHIDHIDGNGLNNKKNNLRLSNYTNNNKNKKANIKNTSGYKGVSFHKRDKTFQTAIKSDGKTYYSCGHKTAILAAEKYNELALKYHGEHAHLNTI